MLVLLLPGEDLAGLAGWIRTPPQWLFPGTSVCILAERFQQIGIKYVAHILLIRTITLGYNISWYEQDHIDLLNDWPLSLL